MRLKKALGLLFVVAPLSAALSIISAGSASAATLGVTGTCGDTMTMSVAGLGAPIITTITIPDTNSADVWTLSATEQEFRADTGAPFGNPFPVSKNEFTTPLSFNSAGTGFTAVADIENLSGMTSEISYTATRTSPAQTCTNHGFWTDPATGPGPVAQNPTGAPGIPG